jgi:hypothetical protein
VDSADEEAADGIVEGERAADDDDAADVWAGFEEATGAVAASAAAGVGVEAGPTATVRKPVPRRRSDGGKAMAVPVLLTLGVLMLVPAVWSLLHLTGLRVDEAANADIMALFMLVCWPLALFLIGSAAVMLRQLRRGRRGAAGGAGRASADAAIVDE